MGEAWYARALGEIDKSHREMNEWEKDFIKGIRERIEAGFFLSPAQESSFLKIHGKMTGLTPLKR